MYLTTLPQQINAVITAGVCGPAFWRGGKPERIVAGVVVFSWLVSPLVVSRHWEQEQWGVLAVDGLVLGVLVALALRTDRRWVIWAAGFQLVAVVVDTIIGVDRQLAAYTYLTGSVLWSYLVKVALAVGTWDAWRRRALVSQRAREAR